MSGGWQQGSDLAVATQLICDRKRKEKGRNTHMWMDWRKKSVREKPLALGPKGSSWFVSVVLRAGCTSCTHLQSSWELLVMEAEPCIQMFSYHFKAKSQLPISKNDGPVTWLYCIWPSSDYNDFVQTSTMPVDISDPCRINWCRVNFLDIFQHAH